MEEELFSVYKAKYGKIEPLPRQCCYDPLEVTTRDNIICKNCLTVLGVESIGAWSDTSSLVTKSSYERMPHFTHLLEAAQGIDRVKLPQTLVSDVCEFIRYNGFENSVESIRFALKSLACSHPRYETFYPSAPRILYLITGNIHPQMSDETMATLHQMFKKAQPVLDRHTTHRKSAISYPYIIHKLLEIIGEYEWMNHFKLLKSRGPLFKLDVIWRQVCEELGWPFNSSFNG